MGLYGMMRTSASGMAAQANRLSTVADNIANSGTTGYKRASAEFASLILQSGQSEYTSGSVDTHIRYAISEQGSFKFTTSATDLGIKDGRIVAASEVSGAETIDAPPTPWVRAAYADARDLTVSSTR